MSLAETETFLQIPEVQEIGAALKKRMQELRERETERDHKLQNFGFSICIIFTYCRDSLLLKEHPTGHFTYIQLQIC